jgi:hypothetical protein
MEYSDKEIIDVIKMLQMGKGDDKQIELWDQQQLNGLNGVFDLIFYSKEELTPEEILKLAREQNKPILL